MMDEREANPDYLEVVCLSDGYVINCHGKSYARAAPGTVAKLVKEILEKILKDRESQPPGAIAGTYKPVQVQPVQPQPAESQPVVQPVETPAPKVEPPVEVNLQNARTNLGNLVRMRVARHPECQNDTAFWRWTRVYCVGLSEDEMIDALDRAMTGQNEQVDDYPPDGGVQGVVGISQRGPRAGAEIERTQSGAAFAEPELFEMTLADMVDDFVIDEETGGTLSDQEIAMLSMGG